MITFAHPINFAYPQGIDKITIWIHPYLIKDFSQFHRSWGNNTPICYRVTARNGYSIDFQDSMFDPSEIYYNRVLELLAQASVQGILKRPKNKDFNYIVNTFDKFFTSFFVLDELELFFDVLDKDIKLSEKQYKPENSRLPNYKTSRYANTYLNSSSPVLIAYDRIERLMHVNQLPRNVIETIRYTKRIEFKLNRRNCGYMHPLNINGDYNYIYNKFLYFMAKRWNKYGSQIATLQRPEKMAYAVYLNKVRQFSGWTLPHCSKFMLKTPPCPIPNKSVKKKDVDRNWLVQFSLLDWQ
jgi:hypothetical protein